MEAAWWCAAFSRSLEVPNICYERQHAVPHAIACDLQLISNRNFRKLKSCVRNRARSRQNRSRLVVRSFLATIRGPQHLLRASACCAACDCVRSGADFEPKFSKIFTAAKFCVRNCARSRLNGSRLVVRSFLATLRGPQHLLRASACCAACDCVRSAADFEPKFSKIENFAFEIARDRA